MDNGATAGAGSDSELGPRAASRKAGYAGPGPRSAEPKERAWSMTAAGTSELSAAPAGSPESRRTFP